MSILTEKPQNAIIYKERKYPINTDFRVWLEFDRLMREDSDPAIKIEKIIRLCVIPGRLPPVRELIQGLFNFYLGASAKENEKKSDKTEKSSKAPIFDYEIDAGYILSAFLEIYGIDLTTCDMHWHKFQALLWSLPEDCRLMKIIGYRDINTAEIKDKSRRKMYERLKKTYALPDTRTEEEKEFAFANELSKL